MLPPASPAFSARQRALHYWFADGFSTLVAGLGCLLFALSMFYGHNRRFTPVSILVALLLLFAYVAITLRRREIVEWLKSRITYPRTGFALPPSLPEESATYANLTVLALQEGESKRLAETGKIYADRKRRTLLMAAAVSLAMFSLMLVQQAWICAAAGVLMSVGLWIGTLKEQPLSWLILAGFPLVGLGMALLVAHHVGGADRGARFLARTGALFFLDGALTLFRYLRRNPMPKPTQSL